MNSWCDGLSGEYASLWRKQSLLRLVGAVPSTCWTSQKLVRDPSIWTVRIMSIDYRLWIDDWCTVTYCNLFWYVLRNETWCKITAMFAMEREERKVDGNLALQWKCCEPVWATPHYKCCNDITHKQHIFDVCGLRKWIAGPCWIIFGEIIFPKYLSIQKYACFVRACFSSPFQELASTYIDVKQMVTVKICGYQWKRCDWPNQCLMWQPNTWFKRNL